MRRGWISGLLVLLGCGVERSAIDAELKVVDGLVAKCVRLQLRWEPNHASWSRPIPVSDENEYHVAVLPEGELTLTGWGYAQDDCSDPVARSERVHVLYSPGVQHVALMLNGLTVPQAPAPDGGFPADAGEMPADFGAACIGACSTGLTCFSAIGGVTFPDGLCSRGCGADPDCGPNGICREFDGHGVCLLRCAASAPSCRLGYACCDTGGGTCAPTACEK
jgi:hypothetical protein